jgi:hypothetical protein
MADVGSRLVAVLEGRIAPALERIALALERGQGTASDPYAAAIARISEAMEQGQWAKARTRVAALLSDFPGLDRGQELAEEVAHGQEAAIQSASARLAAARAVNDPNQVVAIRDELAALLPAEARSQLDRDVVQWLMAILQRRMRAGTVRPDVAELAAKMADRFGETKEGASLRAALPTLRRSAGLCARCGLPYPGIANTCPRCTGVPDPEDDEDFLKSPPGPT